MEVRAEFRNEDWFSSAERDWQQLLDASDADPLFLSWHWMYDWWQRFHRPGDRLRLIAAYRGDRLIGLAPLYQAQARYLRGLLPVQRLQFLGTGIRRNAGLRSEYLGFILDREQRDAALDALLGALGELDGWQEACFQDVPSENPLTNRLDTLGKRRELSRLRAYPIDTSSRFEDYLASLGRNTRLKLYNRRKLLNSLGQVELRPGRDLNQLIDILNKFDMERFGYATLNQRARTQLHALDRCTPDLPVSKHSSLLLLDGKPLSVVINCLLQGQIYNFQLGYQPNFHKKISLGTLHLGYAIEQAFNDPDIHCFDLLLGGGKNSDYKRHLSDRSREAVSWQVMRSPLLKTLFAINDNGKRLLRRLSSS